jgi:5'(3')-deoxyribonucleotidase
MTPPIVLLDCDGPLLSYTHGICAAANERLSPDQHINPSMITRWDVLSFITNEKVRSEVSQMRNGRSFWANLPVVEGARDGIEQLRSAGVGVKVVTSPFLSCDAWGSVRYAALKRHFGISPDDVHVTADKSVVRGDAFVDDKPSHVLSWQIANPLCAALLYDLPHNRQATSRARFMWSPVHLDALISAAKAR